MARDFKGIWIPRELWFDKTLTTQEKLFYLEIDSLDMDNGCFASNPYFSEFFGISITRVSIVINSLVKKGYIKSKIEYKKGTKQILKRVLNICYRPYATKVKDPMQQKLKTPIKQKLKDNNTDINNKFNNSNLEMDKAFKDFYSVYPKKRARGQAEKSFIKLWKEKKLPPIEELIKIIHKWKTTEEFKNTDMQFVKNPSTWLNGYGWEDEIIEESPEPYDKEKAKKEFFERYRNDS